MQQRWLVNVVNAYLTESREKNKKRAEESTSWELIVTRKSHPPRGEIVAQHRVVAGLAIGSTVDGSGSHAIHTWWNLDACKYSLKNRGEKINSSPIDVEKSSKIIGFFLFSFSRALNFSPEHFQIFFCFVFFAPVNWNNQRRHNLLLVCPCVYWHLSFVSLVLFSSENKRTNRKAMMTMWWKKVDGIKRHWRRATEGCASLALFLSIAQKLFAATSRQQPPITSRSSRDCTCQWWRPCPAAAILVIIQAISNTSLIYNSPFLFFVIIFRRKRTFRLLHGQIRCADLWIDRNYNMKHGRESCRLLL